MRDGAVITGCGAVTSLAPSAGGTWSAVLAGASGVRALLPGTEPSAGPRAALASGLDAQALGVAPRDARIMGLPSLLLLASARDAMDDAGLDPKLSGPDAIAFYAGMGMVDPAPEDLRAAVLASRGPDGIDYRRFFGDGYREIHPLWPLAMLNNVGFCLAAGHAGVSGENAVFSPGADSALLALSAASDAVVSGRATAALAAGASERVSAASVARAGAVGGWDGPESRCVPGEGAAAVVVESAQTARARGAAALATVAGWGFSFSSAPAAGFAAAMERAMKHTSGATKPADAVLLHDERCQGRDKAERKAVAGVLGAGSTPPVLLSSKGIVGHCLAGGPAVDVLLAARMLAEGVVPPALTATERSPGRTDDPAPALTMRPRRIVVNCCSWGGSYGSVVLDVAE